jgi:DNA-directed RNA polymerase II subunit RPB7
MGFFAEAGPLTVFVSNHLIPEDFEFQTTNEPCYVTADGDQKVLPGSEVRMRVVGTRVDANEIVSAPPRPATARPLACQPACTWRSPSS